MYPLQSAIPVARFARFSRLLAVPAALTPCAALAFSPGVEDAIADFMVWVVLIFVPILAVWVFWKIHVMPEIIAEKRHHPQKDAIQALCITSLLFGGLLWPLAWIWACTRPIGYQLAYGRDKHEDYYAERGAEAEAEVAAQRAGEPSRGDDADAEALRGRIARLRQQLRKLGNKPPAGGPGTR